MQQERVSDSKVVKDSNLSDSHFRIRVFRRAGRMVVPRGWKVGSRGEGWRAVGRELPEVGRDGKGVGLSLVNRRRLSATVCVLQL